MRDETWYSAPRSDNTSEDTARSRIELPAWITAMALDFSGSGISLLQVGAGMHIPHIKRRIRYIKERATSIVNGLTSHMHALVEFFSTWWPSSLAGLTCSHHLLLHIETHLSAFWREELLMTQIRTLYAVSPACVVRAYVSVRSCMYLYSAVYNNCTIEWSKGF